MALPPFRASAKTEHEVGARNVTGTVFREPGKDRHGFAKKYAVPFLMHRA